MKELDPAREEEALRARFAALRGADRAAAPSFDAVADRPRGRHRGLAWSGLAVAGLAAAVVAALALVDRTPMVEHAAPVAGAAISEVMLSVAAEMPSDFLLAPPSDDVRRDTPRLTRADNDEVPFL